MQHKPTFDWAGDTEEPLGYQATGTLIVQPFILEFVSLKKIQNNVDKSKNFK